jgi:hypothetical protein
MDHFGGLDVSVKETSICIVDDTGRIMKEVKVASEPQALLKVLGNPAYCFKRIGLEAGPLSQWLFSGLAEAGLPVVCVETRQPAVEETSRPYCCKSRKSNNPKNLAKVDLWTSLLLRRFSTPLRRSVIDFG